MKKGFISITVIYSFLLVFIFTLLALLVLYTQKSRLVDTIVYESKEQIYDKNKTLSGDIVTFEYTGNYQEYVASKKGYYFIETYGAQGGDILTPNVNGDVFKGGRGGYSSGYIYLNRGETLYVYVGGQGQVTSRGTNQTALGGYNGGGSGMNHPNLPDKVSSGGGGATDIRYFGNEVPIDKDWSTDLGLNSRIMVAAGGGGAFSCITCQSVYRGIGGNGGTLVGGAGSGLSITTSYTAEGGTQISGNYGKGVNGSTETPGGGGGYYGGVVYSYSAGGGSSFISGYAGVNAITSSTDTTPTNNTIHYSGKYFINGNMKAGVKTGNGKATIKYIGESLPRTNTKLNNIRYIKDCINGSTVSTYNSWGEIQAIKDGINIAKGISPSGTTTNNKLTDGDVTTYYSVNNTSGVSKCVTIDLGSTQNLDEIGVWHYYLDERTYFSNITYASSDDSNWTEVLNESKVEDSKGKRINAYSEPLNGYVQEGLLVLYDGLYNTQKGRSISTTTWTNLASSSYSTTDNIKNGIWGEDHLIFDGSSTYVEVGDIRPDKITMEAVFNSNSITSWKPLIGNNTGTAKSGYLFFITRNNDTNISAIRTLLYLEPTEDETQYYSNNDVQPLKINYNKTYSGATTYDKSSLKMYINGEYANKKNYSQNIQKPSDGTTTMIGTLSTDGSATPRAPYFSGKIYSVRIYNRSLTAEEIKHNYLIDKEKFSLN